jgi:hypothetical protein
MGRGAYAFGDRDVAARRLALLAAVSAPTSLEDTEAIETEHPAFAEYLRRVRERLEQRGQRLTPGPVLARLAGASRAATATPTASHAAAMFRLNLDSWCDDADVRDRLGRALEDLLDDERVGVITWRLRQAVVEAPTI